MDKIILQAQGYDVACELHKDNQSEMKLLQNGKSSSSKRTRALNIRYFFLTDQIEKGNLSIHYCNTHDMVADFMTKPLQGEKFIKFKNAIMGSVLS